MKLTISTGIGKSIEGPHGANHVDLRLLSRPATPCQVTSSVTFPATVPASQAQGKQRP